MSVDAPGDLLSALLDPRSRPDPYPIYAGLRAAAPLHLPGTIIHVFTSYADCQAALRHAALSTDDRHTQPENAPPPLEDLLPPDAPPSSGQPSFLFLDPPDHTRLRRLVSSAFTARVVARLESRIATLVDDMIDRAAERADGSPLDLVRDLAAPLPTAVICDLLGVPLDDEPKLRHWSAQVTRTLDPVLAFTGRRDPQIADQVAAEVELHKYLYALVDQRRAHPRDDLLSALLAVEESGDSLTADELVTTCGLLLVAGHETTVNLIANGVLALLRHPDTLAALSVDPSLAPAVVEEVLRYDPPVQITFRIATTDVEVNGTPLPQGHVAVLLLAAAQRDGTVNADPDRFDPFRPDPGHLAFGHGPHYCLGAPLARLEGRLALARFARRVIGPELVADPPPYREHLTLRGMAELPVTTRDVAPRETAW